ncbi:MAG: nitroreductase family protein [Endomicrobiales bacterium]|nr:nitroreductase family protein [Endomicrobiales bacterium]
MNQVIENIRARRSVRSFDGRPIPKDVVDALMDSANLAPTGANSQPWRFVVVQDPGFIKKLSGLCEPRYRKWMENAPQQLKDMRKEIDAKVSDPIYYGASAVVFVVGKGMTSDFDCPMACQNIMLAARSLGIGSCWVFFGQMAVGEDEVKKALELQEGEKVYGPIALGYPKEGFPEGPPKRPASVKII